MPTAINILIVEDSEDDTDLVLAELRSAGFAPEWKRVDTEPRFLAEIKNLPDLILADYSLPQFSGLRAAKLLRESGLDIPFILISGTVGEDVAVEAMKLGATDYLLKDRMARLGNAVQLALEQQQLRRQRHQTEDELRATHLQLRQILEHSPAVIYALKVEGQKVAPYHVSENITDLLGFTVSESLHYEWWLGQVHPEDRDRAVASISETLTQGTSLTEYRLLHRDGSYRWVEDKRRLIRDSSSQPMEIVGFWADITERKHAEEVLRESSRQNVERQRARMIKDLVVIFAICIVAFLFLYFTHPFQAPVKDLVLQYLDLVDNLIEVLLIALLGFCVLAYRRWREFHEQASEQLHVQEALRTLHGDLEIRVQQRTAELTKANEGLRTEIAERKRTEEAQRESEQRLRQLAENIQEVFWMTDPDKDQVLYVSPAYERIWGRSAENLYRSPREWAEAICPEDRARVLEAAATKLVTGQYDEVFRIQGRDGSLRWIRDRAYPIHDESGRVYRIVGTAQDITEQRHLEEELRQSQKLEGIGQLAGGIAHDFNNILAVIIMQAELTGVVENLPNEAREGLAAIRAAGGRAAKLTRQLLMFSRKQVMQSCQLDLNEVVTSLAQMLRRLIREDVRLELHLQSTPLMTFADASMLDQVLINLAVNARDAMPKGGRLTIETTEKIVSSEQAAQNSEESPGRFVCLIVSDTGCGIPPEIQSRIFEPFYTTKAAGEGTGLGLATVFGVVKQHQGWLKVYSEVGKGTTFQVFLPASDVPADEALAEANGKPSPRSGSETILVVEDDDAVRMLTRVVLERNGYHVLEAADGVEAQRVWAAHQGKIALLLTDLIMPGGVDGRELGACLQSQRPGLKVIFSSGYSAEIAGRELKLQAGQNFIQKPCLPDQLLEAVRNCLDR